jgi:hypothetical protein
MAGIPLLKAWRLPIVTGHDTTADRSATPTRKPGHPLGIQLPERVSAVTSSPGTMSRRATNVTSPDIQAFGSHEWFSRCSASSGRREATRRRCRPRAARARPAEPCLRRVGTGRDAPRPRPSRGRRRAPWRTCRGRESPMAGAPGVGQATSRAFVSSPSHGPSPTTPPLAARAADPGRGAGRRPGG